jgi:hypothetical protein
MTTAEEPIKAPMPENVSVEHRADGLRLSYRWFSGKFIFLAFFCLVWDGFLIFWYSMAFTQNADLMMLIFPVLHVAVGFSLTYYTLAGFYNRTFVSVGRGTVSIEHRPIPWFGNRTLQAPEIAQLYTEQITTSGKNGPQVSYQLSAVSQDNKKIRLLSGMDSLDSARYIERQVEDWLGIRDRRVEGEMPK